MLMLVGNTDKIEVELSNAGQVEMYGCWGDADDANPPIVNDYNRANITHNTAAIIDFIPVGSGATQRRNIKYMQFENAHASLTTDVTVYFNISGTRKRLRKFNLKPGEGFYYKDGVGWVPLLAPIPRTTSGSCTIAQIASHSADTYYLGMSINGRLQAGSWFRWCWRSSKGAAGTATPIYTIRFGTAGTTADTARITMTGAAQTAAADEAWFCIEAGFRVVGASAVLVANHKLIHRLATTGFSVTATNVFMTPVVSGTFDSSIANSIIGLSVNPGTSGAWVTDLVTLDAVNLLEV